jgi:HAD superfamily hydrolase (TIGR01456 family)
MAATGTGPTAAIEQRPQTLPSLLSKSAKLHKLRATNHNFAYSIDGVLLRSSAPIPGAPETLSFLQKQRIPFILLTNGGGKHESDRVAELSDKLSVPLDTSMFVQSHTPFAEFVYSVEGKASLKDECIMVLGGDYGKCRDVAERYGFTNVITPGDIFAAYPEIWPFSKVFVDYYKSFARPLPLPINHDDPDNSLKIDAIFVFNDPRDWALDIQILLDVLLSRNGIMGTYSVKNNDRSLPNNGYQQDGQPPLYFSNADLLWAAGYHLSRLGQGGFREAFEGVWAAVTGGPREGVNLQKTVIGKPFKETYEFSEKMLIQHRENLFDGVVQRVPLRRVYMVGDNPESDIRGSNTYQSPHGTEWISLLTRTGVYKGRPADVPSWQPREIVDDVYAAVDWALKDSKWPVSLK